jgi:hypothetical protein
MLPAWQKPYQKRVCQQRQRDDKRQAPQVTARVQPRIAFPVGMSLPILLRIQQYIGERRNGYCLGTHAVNSREREKTVRSASQ